MRHRVPARLSFAADKNFYAWGISATRSGVIRTDDSSEGRSSEIDSFLNRMLLFVLRCYHALRDRTLSNREWSQGARGTKTAAFQGSFEPRKEIQNRASRHKHRNSLENRISIGNTYYPRIYQRLQICEECCASPSLPFPQSLCAASPFLVPQNISPAGKLEIHEIRDEHSFAILRSQKFVIRLSESHKRLLFIEEIRSRERLTDPAADRRRG